MHTLQEWLDLYGESHRNPTNKLIHWICVPTIYFSTLVLLFEVRLPVLTDTLGPFASLGGLVALPVLAFYLRLSRSLFVGLLAFSAICFGGYLGLLQVAHWVPAWAVAIAVFGVSWVAQFYGHKVEGKKPSFFQDVQFLLIGPAWLMHFVYRKAGIAY